MTRCLSNACRRHQHGYPCIFNVCEEVQTTLPAQNALRFSRCAAKNRGESRRVLRKKWTLCKICAQRNNLNFSNRIHRISASSQTASKERRHAQLRRKICKLWRRRVDYSREKILTAASRITRGTTRRKAWKLPSAHGEKAQGNRSKVETLACTATESCTSHTHSYFFGRKYLSSRSRARAHPRTD